MIDDEYGVFVAPTGDDTSGLGTQAAPFASVTKGMAEAKTAGKRLYVCADGGEYPERLALTADSAGVSAYGSFRCADWGYDSTLKARVAPTTEGYAFEADSINVATRLEGFEFEAQSATAPGGNSVAGFVKTSSALSLVRVKFIAGDGADGAAGTRTDFVQPGPGAVNGNPATGMSGGGSKSLSCPGGGMTTGALGGAGDSGTPGAGSNGLPALTSPNPNGGRGGAAEAVDCTNGSGAAGNPGTAGPGGPGATASGTLIASAWQAAAGGAGSPGTVAQGGGGGRGGTSGGGGGGAAGGCGGAAGGGGGGGGASIALLLINSPVVLQESEFVAGAAGDGGAGSNGQAGLLGGKAGLPAGDAGSRGCPGGDGGLGGAGGGGGGGAGGVSVGILYVGTAPTRTGGSTTTGTAGAPGQGGLAGGVGPAAASGVAGVSEDELEVTL